MKKFLFIFLAGLLLFSCARVGSPVGGAKDTIPPVVVRTNIDSPRVNVPRDIRELRIDFDEYISLKEINKNLIISPPLTKIKKILPAGMANKYLLIQWEDTLQANTTYNFNFGNAIVDNNEGNPLRYYNFAFSTGEKIDDLYISGEVKNLFPDKKTTENTNIAVGLYKATDSMNYRQKPYYITKADPDGYFELNYLSPGSYRILAFEDENQNSVYDAGKEKVGFLKETVVLEESISGLNLKLVPSRKAQKYVEMSEMPGGVLMTFEGNPRQVEVKSINPKLQNYKVTHRTNSDSVRIWFDAQQADIGITASENLKFSYDTGTKKDAVSLFYRYNTKNEMSLSNVRGGKLAPGSEFRITSNYSVDRIEPEKWQLVADSVKQEFTAAIAKENPFEIEIRSDFKEGKNYSLTVPKETVASFYETVKKSYRFDFEADKTENFGSLTVTLENAPTEKFWFQLLNSSGQAVYSRYTSEPTLSFTYLKPDRYELRILVDNNGNGLWDAADLSLGEFAEDVYINPKKIEIRPLWEIRETWNLKAADDAGTLPTAAPQPNTTDNENT